MEEFGSYKLFDGKVIIRIRDRICDTPDRLLSSSLFLAILKRCVAELARRGSHLMDIFDHTPISDQDVRLLVETLQYLAKLPGNLVMKVVPDSQQFFRDPILFNDFVEYLYNYWRHLHRLIVCDSEGDRLDQHPYRTFNQTVETLTHLVRSTYREVQENITGNHPRIYRQVHAGAEVAAIALPRDIPYPAYIAAKLNHIAVIRQVLIYPPLIFSSPTNKRTGSFERIDVNPLEKVNVSKEDWLCYPARVGSLVVMVYFSIRHFELGFSLSNLFELADDSDLKRQPDAVFLYGVPGDAAPHKGDCWTVFYEDEASHILVATIPDHDQFGYFGYLKKMMLTLHNIQMMRSGKLPFHGALFNLRLREKGNVTILLMGDTGAGKSETLEAMRTLGDEKVEDITIVADDMGSLALDDQGRVIGYGTETGAFVRLDDLQPGYAFGQIDRTIILNPNQTNARVVLPVTTFANIVKGFPVDYVLYANNYEEVDADHPILEKFQSTDEALPVFRAGKVMSKGTTTSSGLVETYFANIFGPQQYPGLHEQLVQRYFDQLFRQGAFVGQVRTQLGLPGMERRGPEQAARALLNAMLERPTADQNSTDAG
jgi:energy-coupling factor transporter ATP-binding protein EcfA2